MEDNDRFRHSARTALGGELARPALPLGSVTPADRVDAVKQKLGLADHVRAHPWPALAVALGIGAAIAASGSDRKVASATGRDDHAPDHERDDGFFARIRERFADQARELGEHLGRAADDIMNSSSAPRRAADVEVPLP